MTHTFNLKEASTITNLRPAEVDGSVVYRPVAPKKELKAMAGRRPLVRLTDGDIHGWLLEHGYALEGLVEGNEAPTTVMASTPGSITGAMLTGKNRALVMCGGGSVEVSLRQGQWSVRANGRSYPSVSFRATTRAACTCTVGNRALSENYTGGTTLGAASRRALADDLARAYLNACADGAAEGLFTAPVVMWCRYIDANGRELQTTPPVVVRPEENFSPWVETTVADGKTVAGYVLTVPCCGIEAVFEGADCPEVNAVEIYATPCLHPYRKWQQGTVVPTRSGGLRISLPGYGTDLCQSGARAAAAMRRILACHKSMGRLLATIPEPFDGHARVKTVHHPGGESADAAGEAVEAALSAPRTTPTLPQVLMESPHTFGADVMASDARTVLWSGLRPVRSRGFSPLLFADRFAEAPAGGGRALVTVSFCGSGRRGVVLALDLPDMVPTRFWPVLSYPSPDAASMRITVFDGTTTRSGAFALTPDGSGRRSVYVSEGLAPIELPVVSATMTVDVSEPDDSRPGLVAVCATDEPLVPKVLREMVAPLEAAVPLGGSDSAWEFGRSRYVAASCAGLTSLTVGEGLRSLSVRLIDARPAAALCQGPDGVFAALPECVVRVSTGNRKCVAILKGSFTGLAWDGAHGELLCMNATGCTVWSQSADMCCLRTDCAAGSGIFAGGEHFIAISERIYSAVAEEDGITVPLRVEARLEVSGASFMPRRLCLHCSGRLEEGSVRLIAGGNDVCRAELSGDVRIPPVLPLLCRRVQGLTLVIEGESDDLRLHAAKVLA